VFVPAWVLWEEGMGVPVTQAKPNVFDQGDGQPPVPSNPLDVAPAGGDQVTLGVEHRHATNLARPNAIGP
jgi:hypothetical protein